MFTLAIPYSKSTLAFLKAELTRKLPEVKSSHRCEAMARGLGFRTYAAAQNAASSDVVTSAIIDGQTFADYLAERQLSVGSEALYQAAAKVALRSVSELFPKLTAWGIGVGRPRRNHAGRLESSSQMSANFQNERKELTDDISVKAFLVSLAFVQLVTPTKSIRPNTGSYKLKHIAENFACTYPEGQKLGPTYVANGVFIAAGLHAGFKMKTYVDDLGYDHLNVSFNMSKSCIDDLDCQIRPNGNLAEDRRRKEELKRFQRNPFGYAASM